MTWATYITIGRIVLIPVFAGLLLYYDEAAQGDGPAELWRLAALAVFIVAAASDALDGYLARYHGQASELGALLDPIADKLLMLAALVLLGIVRVGTQAVMPLWFPVVIIGRDFILLVGFLVLQFVGVKVALRPHWSGKLATFFTFAAIVGALLEMPQTLYACVAAGLAAIICLVVYLREGTRAYLRWHASSGPPDKRPGE